MKLGVALVISFLSFLDVSLSYDRMYEVTVSLIENENSKRNEYRCCDDSVVTKGQTCSPCILILLAHFGGPKSTGGKYEILDKSDTPGKRKQFDPPKKIHNYFNRVDFDFLHLILQACKEPCDSQNMIGIVASLPTATQNSFLCNPCNVHGREAILYGKLTIEVTNIKVPMSYIVVTIKHVKLKSKVDLKDRCIDKTAWPLQRYKKEDCEPDSYDFKVTVGKYCSSISTEEHSKGNVTSSNTVKLASPCSGMPNNVHVTISSRNSYHGDGYEISWLRNSIKVQYGMEFSFSQSGSTTLIDFEGSFIFQSISFVMNVVGPCLYVNQDSCTSENTPVCVTPLTKDPPTCTPKYGYCEEKKCQNGGTCRFNFNEEHCICPPSFRGEHCEINTCPFNCTHGECDGSGSCICNFGWSGKTCNSRICDQKVCHHGKCEQTSDSIKCFCDRKQMAGEFCEFLCRVPCLNGECVALEGETMCVCQNGWEGHDCSLRVEKSMSRWQQSDNFVPKISTVACLCILAIAAIVLCIIFINRRKDFSKHLKSDMLQYNDTIRHMTLANQQDYNYANQIEVTHNDPEPPGDPKVYTDEEVYDVNQNELEGVYDVTRPQ